ncbi:MAG: hypothetical protein AB1609_09205 [Bacillota bacterium]
MRGHVAVCFLAFVLESHLRHKLGDTVSYRLRTELLGTAATVFHLLRVPPPNRIEELSSNRAA